ncbi:small ribosomal subunit protein eS12 [Trichomonascus vanleenenianus]|uniref:40S ribosomal protein eS12 RPS12 n=1 Tax=Trichomonascus vanleenenianus TaxID=2268995 RepID=UPI003ECB9D7D
MSDVEEVQQVEEVEVAVESVAPGQMTIEDALQGVLKKALIHDGLARGLREATKALSSKQAHVCVLVDTVTEEAYPKLIEALCNESENPIPLVRLSDAKKLGEWAGLCQHDREGNARKVVGCSCVVVKDWGEDSEERNFLLNYLNSQ